MTRVRAAALVVDGSRVLLARHVKDGRTAFLLPGGGIEPHENAHDALRRELREEAGADARIGELRYVIETIAPDAARHLVQVVFEARLLSEVGASTDPRVAACEWHEIDALTSLSLRPSFGETLAQDLKKSGTHACRYLVVPWVP